MEQLSGLILFALPLLLLWLVISRTRRQQRALAAAQAAVAPGSWVMTTSGLHGQVVSATTSTVLIEVAPGVHTRWARQAVAEVFDQDPTRDPDDATVVDLTSDQASGAESTRKPAGDDPSPDDRTLT